MKYALSSIVALFVASIIVLLVTACASDGSFASKTKPVDYNVSLSRVCTGVKGLHAVFDGLASSSSLKITADQKAAGDAAAKLLLNFCDPTKPPTDLAGAVAALAVASVDLGDVVGALSK